MLQLHLRGRLRDAQRLERVGRRLRPAGVDVAVAAGPRARVAEDLEGRGAAAPALGDVRAARLLADRVQREPVDELLHVEVAAVLRRAPAPSSTRGGAGARRRGARSPLASSLVPLLVCAAPAAAATVSGLTSPLTAAGRAMRHTTNPWVILVLICFAQFMVVLDATVVNVALPSIQNDLGLSEANLQWIVNAYTLVFGGFLLLGGRAGDLLGRKRLFLGGLVVFTLASLLDGLAVSSGMLIGVARAPGARRRVHLAGRARDHLDHLQGRRRPREGARRLGRDRDRRQRRRTRARRRAHADAVLAVDLLHQRSRRRGRVPVLAAPRAGVEGRGGAPQLRRRRRGERDGRSDGARLRDRAGAARRLGLGADDRDVRASRRRCSSASSSSSCARRRRSSASRSSASARSRPRTSSCSSSRPDCSRCSSSTRSTSSACSASGR